MDKDRDIMVTRLIKSADKGRDTIVIAVTASVLEEEREQIMAAGCDDILRKPFRDSDVFSMMEKHFDVRFVYEDTGVKEPEQRRAVFETDKDLLAALPADLLENLGQAAACAEIYSIIRYIDEIRTYSPELADTLSTLADEFAYDKIATIVTGAGDPL